MPKAPARKGWTHVAFGELVEHIAERVEPTPDDSETYIGLEHLDSGSLTVRRWGTDVPLIGIKLRMRKGDILFARRNAYLRRVALAPHDGLFSAHGMVLRARPDVVLPEFLPFFMQSDPFMDRAEQISVGSLSPTINWSTLKEQQFALPPLEEQRRIAEVLRSSAGLSDSLTALKDATNRVLACATAREFDKLRNDSVPMVRLASLCLRKPQSGIYKSEEFRGRGTPMVNMAELFGNDIIDNDVAMERVDVDEKELERYSLTSDDLLFGRRSVVLEGAGRCVLVGDIPHPVVFESSLLRATIDPERADSRYVFEWLRSPYGHQQIRRIVTFTTVSGVAGSDVARLPIPLPPLPVQKAIAERLSSLRRFGAAPRERLAASRRLSSAVVNALLGGGS